MFPGRFFSSFRQPQLHSCLSEMAAKLYSLKLNLNATSGVHQLPFSGGGPFRITTLKWPEWFVYMQDNKEGNVRGWQTTPGNQGEFLFERIDSNFFLISTMRWKNWYLYMQDNSEGNVRGWEKDPGLQGHWQLTPRDDGSFLLSTEKWPHWYIYMQDIASGNIKSCNGDPGPQGHFMFSCDLKLCNE